MSGKVYITGDTHAGADDLYYRFSFKNFQEGKLLDKDDYVIILGDFGFPWHVDKNFNIINDYEKEVLQWLGENPWTTLFVDGNHENFNYLLQCPVKERFGGLVREVFPEYGIYNLMRGQIYNFFNHKIFTFGGAASIDKSRRIPGVSWWEEELPNYKEFELANDNLKLNNNTIDFILTHTAPKHIVNIWKNINAVYASPDSFIDPTENILEFIVNNNSFKHFYFGHFHHDIKFNDKFTCAYYNVIRII